MIALLGGTGYIGQAFAAELQRRHLPFRAISRRDFDYTQFDLLLEYLRKEGPEFLINAAGFTGKPNVDACELRRSETLLGNTLFPQTIAHGCLVAGVPWGHVSSGCIYSGAKVRLNGRVKVVADLTELEIRRMVDVQPECIEGFSEADEPNFSFRSPPCSFYSGTKALAEEVLQRYPQVYIWRLRIPFDEKDNPRNYLTKLQQYPKVYDNVNSLSHRQDFVRSCLDLWKNGAPFGTYNVTNPGFVTARQVVGLIQKILKPKRPFDFWQNDEEFYQVAGRTPRSNCVMDVSKLRNAGVRTRPVWEALEEALANWRQDDLPQLEEGQKPAETVMS
jgi:dTDP-4-dehydrorhamnose reductase